MPNLALNTALQFVALPQCERCKIKAVAETFGTEATSYTAGLRFVCPKCGMASGWYTFDNYCCAIPVISAVIQEAADDFNKKE